MEYQDLNDYELLHYVSENIEEANDIIIEKYYPLVSSICKKLKKYSHNCGIDNNDLMQEGMLGLTDAINTFSESEEATFYTYAKTCIKRRIISAIIMAHRKKHKFLNESLSYDDPIIINDKMLRDDDNDPLKLIMVDDFEVKLEKELREKLTSFETEVFDLMLSGFNYKEIADILDKDLKQIDNAIQRIRAKTKAVLKK